MWLLFGSILTADFADIDPALAARLLNHRAKASMKSPDTYGPFERFDIPSMLRSLLGLRRKSPLIPYAFLIFPGRCRLPSGPRCPTANHLMNGHVKMEKLTDTDEI